MILETYILNNSIDQVLEGARSISSRTMIRKEIVKFYAGEVSFDEMKSYTQAKYIDGVKALDDCIYAARYVNNQLLVEFRSPQCKHSNNFIADTSLHQLTAHIQQKDSSLIIGAISPIRQNEKLLGFDIIFTRNDEAIQRLKAQNTRISFSPIARDTIKGNPTNKLVQTDTALHYDVYPTATDRYRIRYSIAKLDLYEELSEFKMRQGSTILMLSGLLFLVILFLHQQDRLHYFKKGKYLEQLVEERTRELQDTVAELEATNADLQEKEELLEESNSTKDKFFSILAHDLIGPFSSVIHLYDMVFTGKVAGKQKEIFMQQVSDALKNTYRLLENLLVWSRSQRGKISFDPQKISLKAVSNEVIETLNQLFENKSLRLVNTISPDSYVVADANMLKTVFRNLLSNAIKYTPREGQIELGAGKPSRDGFLEIWVKDSGVGMDEELQKSLFKLSESFSKEGTENEMGSGLGLILCREFVEKHEGRIRVESQPGEGSSFIFTMPSA